MSRELYAIHAISIDWCESAVTLSEEVVATLEEIGPAVKRALAVEDCGHVEVNDNEFDIWKEPHAFETKAERDAREDARIEAEYAAQEARKAADPLAWVDEIRGPRW